MSKWMGYLEGPENMSGNLYYDETTTYIMLWCEKMGDFQIRDFIFNNNEKKAFDLLIKQQNINAKCGNCHCKGFMEVIGYVEEM